WRPQRQLRDTAELGEYVVLDQLVERYTTMARDQARVSAFVAVGSPAREGNRAETTTGSGQRHSDDRGVETAGELQDDIPVVICKPRHGSEHGAPQQGRGCLEIAYRLTRLRVVPWAPGRDEDLLACCVS